MSEKSVDMILLIIVQSLEEALNSAEQLSETLQ